MAKAVDILNLAQQASLPHSVMVQHHSGWTRAKVRCDQSNLL